MLEVIPHIIYLLEHNNFVILPDMGGFVAHYKAAVLHPQTAAVYPPSRQIVFNPRLTKDDGLLIQEIVKKTGLNYDESRIALAEVMNQWKETLVTQKKLFLDELGTLFIGEDGDHHFEQNDRLNFLEDAFGLTSFSFPMRRSSVVEPTMLHRKPVIEKSRKIRKTPVYLVLIPFLVIFGLLYFQWNQLNTKYQFKSGLGVLTGEVVENIDDADESLMNGDTHEMEAEKTLPEILPEENEEKEIPVIDDKEEEFTEDNIMIPSVKRYCVIGGAFREKDNANRLLALLKDKGYNARQAGLSPSGLYMVSIAESDNLFEIKQQLSVIKQKENPSAWLLTRY